jgi:acyl transferase domain-containing protein
MEVAMREISAPDEIEDHHIAIIGMVGRFPGAGTLTRFWQNLCEGRESINFYSDQELEAAAVPQSALNDPLYVKAGALLEGFDLFDASFFNYSPREAEIMDPQHRIYLECAWEALETAGYNPSGYDGRIGVYAGASMSSYLTHLYRIPNLVKSVGGMQLVIGNDKDHLATRVSYKLDLKGPSFVAQTSCSTSLVAVHLACQSLLNDECDIALAGGVCVTQFEKRGYFYASGGISSPDGHCRAFDADAKGTVGGNGVGIVVLKRYAEARASRDNICAVIRGSAINNDGNSKVGYTAPSIEGQASVISDALNAAGLDSGDISYIEAHGTGTALGDPIELKALGRVFHAGSQAKRFCGVGTVKSNIGHLDAAAGIAGLIKTALALNHKKLPPTLHYQRPNPQVDLENSAFYINSTLRPWDTNGSPRRAGVSSFGIGGTNAHVVLEEAPVRENSGPSRAWRLLPLSAKTESALENASKQLREHLQNNPGTNIADVAYTLAVGRMAMPHRRVAICRNADEAIDALGPNDLGRSPAPRRTCGSRPVGFLFPGQGAQTINMGLELYREERLFREIVDHGAELLKPLLGVDLRRIIYPSDKERNSVARQLDETCFAQPAIFLIDYALARQWMHWGVFPDAMLGHSIGEYVAACLAEVFSFEEGLRLTALRGKLMQEMPRGAMVAVGMAEDQLRAYLRPDLSLAAVNTPSLCTVSGKTSEVMRLERLLSAQAVFLSRLPVSHAFHSRMMEPTLQPFEKAMRRISLKPPMKRYLSNLTGDWIRKEEATDPGYWVKHLRETVRFSGAAQRLLRDEKIVLLEVGPGQSLCRMARQQAAHSPTQVFISSLPHGAEHAEYRPAQYAVGNLWLAGVDVNWNQYYVEERRNRVPLPTYAFERQRFWVGGSAPRANKPSGQALKKMDVSSWFYLPAWTRSATAGDRVRLPDHRQSDAIVFCDESDFSRKLIARLTEGERKIIKVTRGNKFERINELHYSISPSGEEDFNRLVQMVIAARPGANIAFLWGVNRIEAACENFQLFEACQEEGAYSLLNLVKALDRNGVTDEVEISLVTNSALEVTGNEKLRPETAPILGVGKVIQQEYPNITVRFIDIELDSLSDDRVSNILVNELQTQPNDRQVALRNQYRWTPTYPAASFNIDSDMPTGLRENGVYLILGGLGNIGLTLAAWMAEIVKARLVLVGNSPFPPKDVWEERLESGESGDKVKQIIIKLRRLEEAGSELLILQANVSDEGQMREVVARTHSRFGALNGVIHAAGVAGAGTVMAIPETGPQEFRRHFDVKAQGLCALEKVLEGEPIDFCFIFSSLSTVLGGLGFAAYSAANHFMDAFVLRHNRIHETPWTVINWDGWQFHKQASWKQEDARAPGILPEEGLEAFRRLVARGGKGQIIVSTGDLQARLLKWVFRPAAARAEGEGQKNTPSGHLRPPLSTKYAPPENELEQELSALWENLLGIQQIGVDDNFFELGGHSLLATQMFSRLRRELQSSLSLRAVFEAPTIRKLAANIEEARRNNSGPLVFTVSKKESKYPAPRSIFLPQV